MLSVTLVGQIIYSDLTVIIPLSPPPHPSPPFSTHSLSSSPLSPFLNPFSLLLTSLPLYHPSYHLLTFLPSHPHPPPLSPSNTHHCLFSLHPPLPSITPHILYYIVLLLLLISTTH